MKKPHEIYKLHPDNTRQLHKVKLWLKETLSEKISLLRCPEVVSANDSIEVLTTIAHPKTSITSAAATLRADILSWKRVFLQ